MAGKGGKWKNGEFIKARKTRPLNRKAGTKKDLPMGSGIPEPSASPRQELSSSDMQERVPQFGGNSRIFAARSLIERGNLKDQAALREFDMGNYIGQLSGLNSRSIRQSANPDGTMTTYSGSSTGKTSSSAYRQYAAQANRDARRIWNAANSETKEYWASRGDITGARSSKNSLTRRISRDISRRYERQQEQAATARRAAKTAKRAQASSGDDGLAGLFG